MKLLIATGNQGKVREVRHILAGIDVDLCSLEDFPAVVEAVEDGDSFTANAQIKALHYARQTGQWALADDSGLEVDALDGAPGVHSARFAGSTATDAENNRKLISLLSRVPAEQRTARFRCAVALATPDGILAEAAGAVAGVIVDDARGGNGFGYDPHFFLPEHEMTAAQMPPELKNRISHRGQALRAMLPALRQHLASPA